MVFPPGIVITFHIVFIALNTLMFFGHLKFEPHKSQPSKIRTMRAISDATGALGFTAALIGYLNSGNEVLSAVCTLAVVILLGTSLALLIPLFIYHRKNKKELQAATPDKTDIMIDELEKAVGKINNKIEDLREQKKNSSKE
jgi:hypothetical protein